MTRPRLLLASSNAIPELHAVLTATGHAVTVVPLQAAELPLAELSAIVVDVCNLAAATAFTRRVRAETANRLVPIIWMGTALMPATTIVGLEAGADACLALPVEPALLVATLRATGRGREAVAQLARQADESRAINDQLRAEFQAASEAVQLARRAQDVLRPARPATFGPFRFGLATASGLTRADVVRLDDDRVGFWLAEIRGVDALTAELISLFIRLAVQGREDHDTGWRLLPPTEVLDRVNRGLIRLDVNPPPLIGLSYGRLDVLSGAVTMARAGLPPAIHLPIGCEPEAWSEGGPFLGAFDAVFFPHDDQLGPGARLVLATTGTPEEVRAVAKAHRGLGWQASAEQSARDLAREGGASVLIVERV